MENLLQTPATLGLLVINIIASVYAFSNRAFFEDNVFWISQIKQNKQWHRFISSAFLHVNGIHLFINMFVLYEFGTILEEVLGTWGFALLYFISLLGGNGWEYIHKGNLPNYRAVGASGATSGIILAFCLFFPFATLLLFFIIPMWSIVLAVLFVGGSYYLSKKPGTMIAHGAHLGGALAGLAVAIMLRPDAIGLFLQQVSERFG